MARLKLRLIPALFLSVWLMLTSGCSVGTPLAPTPSATTVAATPTSPPAGSAMMGTAVVTRGQPKGTRVPTGAATPIPTVPHSIAAAEAEAARHPQAPPPPAIGLAFQDAPGTGARNCVDVERQRPTSAQNGVRSGEFVAGPFVIYANMWRQNPENARKLWWVPLHTGKVPSLTVRAVALDDLTVQRTFVATTVGYSDRREAFYPSEVVLPVVGRWMLIATAGPNWGCFIVTLAA